MSVCIDYSQFRHDFAMYANGGVPVTTRAADGMEPWPVSMVRAAGFDSVTWSGIDMTVAAAFTVPLDIIVEGAVDCQSYLSQRTDVAANQWFVWTQSGTGQYTLTLTAAGQAANGGGVSFDYGGDRNRFDKMFRNVHAYFCRKSDGAIYWVDLHKVLASRGTT